MSHNYGYIKKRSRITACIFMLIVYDAKEIQSSYHDRVLNLNYTT